MKTFNSSISIVDPPDTREGRTQHFHNQDWKRGFKSYKVTPPPNFQNPNPYNGHAGIQSPYGPPNPNNFGQPLPNSYLRPPAPPAPLPPQQPPVYGAMPQPPVGQTFNTGSAFNIPPMLFRGSPNTSNPDTFHTPHQRPSYPSGQPMLFPQNQPGYPIPPSNPQFGVNRDHNPQPSQNTPRDQTFDSQYPVPLDTNPSQFIAGQQPKYLQGAQPHNPAPYPQSGPSGYNPPHNTQPNQYPTYNQPQGYGSYPKPSSSQGYPQNRQSQNQPGYPQNPFQSAPNSTRPGFENRQDEPQAWQPQNNQGYSHGSPYSGHQPNTFQNQPPSVPPFYNSPLQENPPVSTPNIQPQYYPPSNPNYPPNSGYPKNFVFPSSQTGNGNQSNYPSQFSGGPHSSEPSLPVNPQSNAQNPQGYFPSSQPGSGYPPANSQSPYNLNYNPNIPSSVGSSSEYNPQPQGAHSAPRGFETPQYSPQVPAQGQTPNGYPQSREPQIFPQGGQPGYFLVNQKDNEPPVKRPPPKYSPVDSSKQSARCPSGASGLFPHPNCFKFLNCDHGRTFVMDCAPGTAFNPSISTCDFPDNVDCGRTISGQDPGADEGDVVEADDNNDDYDGAKDDGSRLWDQASPATVGKKLIKIV